LTRFRAFFDDQIPFSENRLDLCDVIRPFWNNRSLEENIKIYGDFPKWLERVDSLDKADAAVLPMHWGYYQRSHQERVGARFAEQARSANKPLVVFAPGDLKPHVPFADAVIFGASLYRSKSKSHHFAHAAFLGDYVAQYLGNHMSPRVKGKKPVVGFCGQASSTPVRLMGMWLRNVSLAVRDKLSVLPFEVPPITPHILLRAKILKTLAQSDSVQTNFLIRDRYWGGAESVIKQPSQKGDLKREFINNIVNSDYTVCVRGSGNFSKRLYETLCCGRIPIFVNTDCVLPFDFKVDWKQYCVWIEEHEIPKIGEIVAAFHDTLSPKEFIELQHKCRMFWLRWLTLSGFYEHFGMHFVLSKSQ